MGYVVAEKSEDGAYKPIIRRKGLQNFVLAEDEELSLSLKYKKEDVYELKNHHSRQKIYASVKQMGIYYNNTPYEDQQWYLIGLAEHQQLFSTSDKITKILLYSSLTTLAIGLFISIMLSKRFTKPIVMLAEQVNRNSYGKLEPLDLTGLKEIDDLSNIIFNSHKRLLELSEKVSRIIDLTNIPFGAYEISRVSDNVFITNHLQELLNFSDDEIHVLCSDKRLFLKRLDDIKKNKADEAQVFLITKGGEEHWVRITQTETDDALLGVVMDATDEIMQAKNLRNERDSDALTGIRNRIAFKRMFDYYNDCLENKPDIGIGLFDLNNLKKVNDKFGHDKGDEYICISTEIICDIFRCSSIFRIGGDEFVAIFNGLESHQIETYHKLLNEKIAESNHFTELKLGIAFGYAIYNKQKDRDLNDTLKRADIRMYENKVEMKCV